MKRRQFFSFLCSFLGSAIGFVLTVPIVGYVLSPLFEKREGIQSVELGDLSDLTEGEVKKVDYVVKRVDGWFIDKTSRTVYVTRKGSDLTVFSSTCTHLGCGVNWDAEQQRFLCPCHGGAFDKEGNVVDGPPSNPLTRLEAVVRDGKVYIEEA